ncbi:arylsulfatase [Robiginitalea marina]|uniref:Arylsulfatase n=1 Tax=Robiginitalea marina TaxID=2954105 RepID=A0ABT1AX26_9FLAO|nr:arylsulfatase [Robiginitalea marina]MCO5724145.1 arylsulfatase [Robiginitalea marina]
MTENAPVLNPPLLKSGSRPNLVVLLILLLSLGSCAEKPEKPIPKRPPNILLIVADDLGYTDLGSYGGDIETPNLDTLAAAGVRFSRFHTSPLCAPTRAMLLSGNDNHIAGMGVQGRIPGQFGYEGHLTDRIVPVPRLLQDGGYHTFMAGKWHLGMEPENNPLQKGFVRSFVNLRGAGNHYDDQGIFEETPRSLYTEDGKPAPWPQGAYSTDFYTDKLIAYMDEALAQNKPFFGFAAYTSPHWPLQVDEKYWKKYEGRYDAGYETLKARRLESLKAAGMVPENAVLPPNHERVIPWDSLTADQQKMEARKMELYAGMVDNLDVNVGRLIRHLKETGQFENTLIVFMSDNGAAAEDFYHHPHYGPFIQKHFTEDYEAMGKANSFISYGPQWAEAGSSPFRYFKEFPTEGGTVAPMIVAGPGIQGRNAIHDEFLTLMDLAPTFYDLAGVTYPEQFEGKEVFPLRGTSILPFLSGKADAIHPDDYVFGLELHNYGMIRKGDWKLTNTSDPFNEGAFALYNLADDLAETNDLKATEPQKYAELMEAWKAFTAEVQAQIPLPGE